MSIDFTSNTYIVTDQLADTLVWLSHHQDCFDSFSYDTLTQELVVYHANGADIIRKGNYLNARYGLLITSL